MNMFGVAGLSLIFSVRNILKALQVEAISSWFCGRRYYRIVLVTNIYLAHSLPIYVNRFDRQTVNKF